MTETDSILLGFLFGVARGLTPLLFAAMAGLISERSGVVQIALEGFLLLGALSAAVISYVTGDPWLGLAGAGFAGVILSFAMSAMVTWFRADGIITGTAINFLVIGLCPLITKFLFDSTGSTPNLPLESRFIWAPIALSFGAFLWITYLYHQTREGLLIRFAGEAPQTLEASGISVIKTRWRALALTGFLAAVGGGTLSTFLASAYSPNMSAGRGFIALAAVIIGGWKPLPTFIACLAFATMESLQVYLQTANFGIPTQLVQVLPYLATILALVFGWSAGRAPQFLGR